MIGGDEPQHGVAEELKSFVGLDGAVLCAPRPVPDGKIEHCGIDKPMAEAVGETGENLSVAVGRFG